MKFNTLFLPIVVCIMCQTVFSSCGNGNAFSNANPYKNLTTYPPIIHNIGKDIFPEEKFPLPYSDEIDKAIEQNPWYGTRHVGDCGTGADAGFRQFSTILIVASFEELIPYLNHKAEYVRKAALDIIKEKQKLWKSEIQTAYENGDSRIKLELLDFVDPHAPYAKRFGLLDEIIQNPNLRVFQSDMIHLNKSKFFKGQRFDNGIKPLNYPFDIVGFNTRLLEDHFVLDRAGALSQLANFGPDASRAVPALVELLKLDDVLNADADGLDWFTHSQKALTAIALGKIGLKSDEVISALKDCIEEKPDVSCYVSFALYKLEDKDRDYLGFLMDMLSNEAYISYRTSIIESLGLIGPDAKIAIPALERLSTDEDYEIRWSADSALEQIEGPKKALSRDIGNLKHENPEIRSDAVYELGRGSDSSSVKKALYDVIKNDQNSEVVFSACSVLEEMEGVNKDKLLDGYIRVLELDGKDDYSPSHVVFLIKEMGAKGKKAIPAMVNFLGTKEDSYVDSTIEAIIAVGGDYDAVVSRLIDAVKNSTGNKSHAIYALGKLGFHAVNALPMLFDEHLESSDLLETSSYNSDTNGIKVSTQEAILMILQSAKKNKTDIPANYLSSAFATKDERISNLAMEFLQKTGADEPVILDKLVKQLNSVDKESKEEAIKRIGEMGESALPLVPLLRRQPEYEIACPAIAKILISLDAGKNYDEEMLLDCLSCWYGIGRDHIEKVIQLGVPEDRVILKIAHLAGDDLPGYSANPVMFLSRYGDKAVIALPVLRKQYKYGPDGRLMNNEAPDIADLIKVIRPKSKITIDEILAMTECNYESIVEASIQAVLTKGGTWDDIAKKLAENLISDNASTRREADRMLYKYKDKCAAALSVLKKYDYSNIQKWEIRENVDKNITVLLQSFNKKSSVSLEDVLVFMNLGSDVHKFEVAIAVARITGKYDKAAEKLAQLSSDKNNETREYCLKVLAELGGNAKTALPILNKIKPIDKTHSELLAKAIKEIETGKIRSIEDVASHHAHPGVPKRTEMYPYGILKIAYSGQKNSRIISWMQMDVDTNMPKGDNRERLLKISNWKFNYKDGSKFPDIVKIEAHGEWDPHTDWTIYFSKELKADKEVILSVKLPSGEFGPEHNFKTPSEDFMEKYGASK